MLDPSSSEESDQERPHAQEQMTRVSGKTHMSRNVEQQRTPMSSGDPQIGAYSRNEQGAYAGQSVAQNQGMLPAGSAAGPVTNQRTSGRADNRDARSLSPSPSQVSEKENEQERAEREEELRRKTIQIYVFVMRCIAYPFNAKQPTDMVKRQTKMSKTQLQTTKERFQSFLRGELSISADEAFMNAVQSYYESFLKSDRVLSMVKGGFCSATDFRDIFKVGNIINCAIYYSKKCSN